MLAKQLKLDETAQNLSESDQKTCPACGITFAEFRQGGRLGCGYDYIHFQSDLEPFVRQRLMTCGTYGNVIRWIPPLVVSKSQIAEGVAVFRESLLAEVSTA